MIRNDKTNLKILENQGDYYIEIGLYDKAIY